MVQATMFSDEQPPQQGPYLPQEAESIEYIGNIYYFVVSFVSLEGLQLN